MAVTIADIKQHVREAQGGAFGDELIQEAIDENTAYVEMLLDLSPLPTDNHIINNILRNFVIGDILMNIVPAGSDRFATALAYREEARQRVEEVNRENLNPNPRSEDGWEDEVVMTGNVYFTPSMFGLADE